MGRAPCCENDGLKKGPWTPEEDEKLVAYIKKHGQGNWRTLPKNAGLARCGKSCRLRWTNYLRPDIKRGRFSFEEEETIIQLHSILGNKWSAIAARLPGRTDNEIKNYWNTHIRKRLLRMGIDPVTHAPRLDLLDFSSLLKPATAAYYPTQADLDTLRALEPLVNYPDLLHLASTLLSTPPQQPQLAPTDQLLLPWLLQSQMAQSVAQAATAAPPQATAEQLLCHDAQLVHGNATCQMPSIVHASQPLGPQDMAACNNVHPSYDSLDVPALMQMVSDGSNLQWSSTVTSSNNNNCNVRSGVSTPSSSPAARMNSSPAACGTVNGAMDVAADAGMFDMQLSELLDVSDYICN